MDIWLKISPWKKGHLVAKAMDKESSLDCSDILLHKSILAFSPSFSTRVLHLFKRNFVDWPTFRSIGILRGLIKWTPLLWFRHIFFCFSPTVVTNYYLYAYLRNTYTLFVHHSTNPHSLETVTLKKCCEATFRPRKKLTECDCAQF